MSLTRTRRTLLMSLAGLAGTAGCADGLGSNRGATDVVVHNEAEVSRTAAVTVTQRGGESPNTDTSLEMNPHSRRKINNAVIMDSDYDVAVTDTDDTRESPYSETQEWNDAGQPLHVLLNDQVVFAVQIG